MTDSQKLSDEEIVEIVRLKTENRDFYAELIERYEKKLLRYAVNLIGDKDRANDAVQESFIKAFINLNGFDAKKKFSSWLYRITHNEAINIIKKDKREVFLADDFDFESGENLEKDFTQKENIDKVEKCLRQMPLLYSEALALFYLEDKSYEEISDILRLPMGTVATRISRAKLIMKKICQKN